MGFISRVVTTGLVALAAGGSYHLLTERHLAPELNLWRRKSGIFIN